MPKPFKLLLEVEEISLGPIMNLLARTDGVLRCDPLLDRKQQSKAKANGHAEGTKAPSKTPYRGEVKAGPFLIGLIAKHKGAMYAKEMADAFEKAGRARSAYASVIWQLKKDGLAQANADGGYTLTKRGRDKARYV